MTSSPPANGASIDANSLRLVLFGLPGSGKSSLLGALGRSAAAKEPLLGGKLEDPGQGLASLARQLGEPIRGRLTSQVATYPIHFVPQSGTHSGPAVDAVLIDTEGRDAGDLLVQQDPLAEDNAEGALAHEIGEADGLILVLDATVPLDQVEGVFTEFARFLESVQKARGARAEVAGFPVFLVLNKCDMLAQPGDGAVAWMERIEQRKRDLATRFREFLADGDAAPTLPARSTPPTDAIARTPGNPDVARPPDAKEPDEEPSPDKPDDEPGTFGRIELHVSATAVRRPNFAGSQGGAQEPYGVAELFRQALAEGSDYRQRCHKARRRLVFLSGASVALVAALLAITVALFALHRNTQLTLLEGKVRDFQSNYQKGAKPFLAGSLDFLRLKKKRLDEIRENKYYPELDPALRESVEGANSDLVAYLEALKGLLERRPPTSEQTEAALEKSTEQLREEDASIRPQWKDTPLAELLHQRRTSAEALGKAVQIARNWYLDAVDKADRLLQFSDYAIAIDGTGIDWPEWTAKAETILGPAMRPPFRPNDPIPDLKGATLSYSAALRIDTVENARRRWLELREGLRRLLAVSSAVGLSSPKEFKALPVLDFPVTFRLSATRQRLAELKLVYPEYQKRFVLDEMPIRARGAIQKASRAQYQRLLKVGRAEVLAQLRQAGKGKEETPARWETVRAWLKAPEELASWRELARTLLRLIGPGIEDPVTELASFLGQKQFTIELDSIILEVPQLSDLRPRADARFEIQHPATARKPALVLESSGTPVRDDVRRVVVYTFRRSGSQRIVFRPGDSLWAELQLSGGKEKLVWGTGRSKLYQIDRLRSAPRRQNISATSLDEGQVKQDVRLTFKPEDGYPAIPDLLPRVNLDD